MKLSTFTDYNLRVLLYLAAHQDRLSTIQEIALAYNISENHLMKVIHHLAKNDLILSIRGKGGGIRLHRAPSELNLGKIVRLAEQKGPIVECLGDKNKCCIASSCRLPLALNDAFNSFYETLSKYTLADVMIDGATMQPLLAKTEKGAA